MITKGESDDELSLMVNQLIDLNAVVGEQGRGDEVVFVAEELRAFL